MLDLSQAEHLTSGGDVRAGVRDEVGNPGAAGVHVRFWGVRGGMPTPGTGTIRYGGNTSCVALRCGQHLVVLDAGSGIRALGDSLLAEDRAVDADILFSHTHLDHICGLQWFAPLYRAQTDARFWASNLQPPLGLENVVQTVLSHPLNPDLMRHMQARMRFTDFAAGATLTLQPGLTVATAPLRHPGDATGYRIEWDGRAVAYITDTEHTPGRPDPNVLRLAAGADVMIFDASYSDAEYPRHVGWGHSTWEEGVRLAQAAGARQLVLFHHDAGRNDVALDAIASAASSVLPGVLVAREGLEIHV